MRGADATLRTDWRFVVAIVSGGHFLSHFYQLTFPPLFGLLVAEFGLSNAQLGLAVSAMSVAALLQLPVGAIVDRVGAYRVFVAGIVVTALGVVLVGFADSYPALLAFAVLSGLGQTAFHPADYAILESVTDEEREGRSFGVHTFSGFAGFAAAPLVVGTLGLTFGWQFALQTVGAVGLGYAVVAALALRWTGIAVGPGVDDGGAADDESPAMSGDEVAGAAGGPDRDGPDAAGVEPDESDADPAGAGADGPGAAGTDADADDGGVLGGAFQPGILVMFGFFLLGAVGSKGIQTFTTVLAVDTFGLTEATGNLALTAFLGASAVSILLGGVLADRLNPRRIAFAASAAVGVGLWLVVLGPGDLVGVAFPVVFGLIGLVAGLIYPSRDRLVSGVAPRGSAGRSFGFVFTGAAIGALASPALLGVVIDATTTGHAFALVGAVYVGAGVVALATGRVGTARVETATGTRGD